MPAHGAEFSSSVLHSTFRDSKLSRAVLKESGWRQQQHHTEEVLHTEDCVDTAPGDGGGLDFLEPYGCGGRGPCHVTYSS